MKEDRFLDWLFGSMDDFINRPLAWTVAEGMAKLMLVGLVICSSVFVGLALKAVW